MPHIVNILTVNFGAKPPKQSTFVEVSTLSRFTFQQLTEQANNEFHNGDTVKALKVVEEMKQRIWNNAV